MTYEQFKQSLIANLKKLFPDGTQISIRPFSQNNHIILDGLIILEIDSNVSPTIYLNHYYEKYLNGTSFSTLQNQILHYYYDHRNIRSIDTSFFTCFEKVHSRIVYKLIHYEKNRELLKEVPHFPYLDLAIVFYYLAQEGPCQSTSIPIFNQHLTFWNISKDTLLFLARKNTPALMASCCSSFSDLFLSALDLFPASDHQSPLEPPDSDLVPMYVLTNQQRVNGACCMLYQNVLHQISEQLNDNLYVLPSSIHEVILIPASTTENPQELSRIVQEINRTEVAPEEVLSDCVYHYNRCSDQILMYQ
ncbi:MAG: hypothetical protein HFH41_01150 [Lachnospiraceae bacterium]|nr:hypothetical protein [Lachnospiraceae bacterium]